MQPALLLVDDDPHVRSATSRALRRLGFTVTFVADAVDARHALAQQRFDIVMSDLDLGPGDDGRVVLTAAREADPTSVRVLFTASIDARVEASRTSGLAHRVIAKPVEMAELQAL